MISWSCHELIPSLFHPSRLFLTYCLCRRSSFFYFRRECIGSSNSMYWCSGNLSPRKDKSYSDSSSTPCSRKFHWTVFLMPVHVFHRILLTAISRGGLTESSSSKTNGCFQRTTKVLFCCCCFRSNSKSRYYYSIRTVLGQITTDLLTPLRTL